MEGGEVQRWLCEQDLLLKSCVPPVSDLPKNPVFVLLVWGYSLFLLVWELGTKIEG